MQILTKNKLFNIFHSQYDNISINDFIRIAKVDNNGKQRPLKEYIISKKLSKSDIQNLYQFIVINKYSYLDSFYDSSLKLPDDITIDELPMSIGAFKNNIKPKYKNIIRNLFYKEILLDTKTDIPNVKTFFEVIVPMFRSFIIDYKLVTPSALYYMSKGNMSSILSGFYFRASIMNPYLVYSLNHTIFNATSVFTPTLGWCSYMYGFLESSNVKKYTGIDVIPKVCTTARQFAKKFYKNSDVSIYCKPSEDLFQDISFQNIHMRQYDTIFFSPPYYRLELYNGGEQSTDRYQTYEEWLEGYWHQTIQLCHLVAKPKAKMCYIISSYKKIPNMVSDMNHISMKYFKLLNQYPMINSSVRNTKHNENTEMIFVFVKK